MKTTDIPTFVCGEIALGAFLLARGAKIIEVSSDSFGHFSFIFEREDLCSRLKQDYLNGGQAPAQDLFAKRELLVTEMKNRNRYQDRNGARYDGH